MKIKNLAVSFALVLILSLSVGVFAQDFSETWDENTVLTVFNDLDMYFPDMFADEDSDFLWVESGPADYPSEFETKSVAKAPIDIETAALDASFDPCGDGLIKYDVTVTKMSETAAEGKYYYGDSSISYISNIDAFLTIAEEGTSSNTYKLGLKTCSATGGDGCKSVSFKKTKVDGNEVYQGHLKGYLTVPAGLIMTDNEDFTYTVDMGIDFATYMTALWPHTEKETGTVYASGVAEASKKNYCQTSLAFYDAFGYGSDIDAYESIRAVYDENTGEARLQAVVRNFQPEGEDTRKQNYVIPAEVFVYNKVIEMTNVEFGGKTFDYLFTFKENDRITDYTCKYTVYNVANAAPRTDYCKFGEGIAVPNHGMVRIDITLDHLSGAVLRNADGKLPFTLRLGGYAGGDCGSNEGQLYTVLGNFEPVDVPCPPLSRLQVKDPLVPFMSSYPLLSDGAISPSGAYGVYEGGLWGMYQKCGKNAYMAVRLSNDGVRDEVIDLSKTAVAINGGTPMKWNWVMSTVEPEKKEKITLPAGEDVILIGRAKLTDIPYQLNADIAMTGAVNFTDLGFYITGKVFSDHNNTRCVAAPK